MLNFGFVIALLALGQSSTDEGYKLEGIMYLNEDSVVGIEWSCTPRQQALLLEQGFIRKNLRGKDPTGTIVRGRAFRLFPSRGIDAERYVTLVGKPVRLTLRRFPDRVVDIEAINPEDEPTRNPKPEKKKTPRK